MQVSSRDFPAWMSSTFQTVERGQNFRGLGNHPSLTPCYQVDLETGVGIAGAGVFETLTKSVRGNFFGLAYELLRNWKLREQTFAVHHIKVCFADKAAAAIHKSDDGPSPNRT
jgi:hypothetical protein